MRSPTDPPPRPGYPDLLEMWRVLLESSWRNLAVVPAGHGVSAQMVVDALLETVQGYGDRVRVFDARSLDVPQCAKLAEDTLQAVTDGCRVVTVVDSLMRSLGSARVVKHAAAVLLVIRVGAPDMESLTSTLNLIGPERILGSVASHEES
jgi:hypothetical protein